jgi:hypothetical protein
MACAFRSKEAFTERSANNEALSIPLDLESILWRGTFRVSILCGMFNEKYFGSSMLGLFVLRELIKHFAKSWGHGHALINKQNA